MEYLLFNNEILISNGQIVKKLKQGLDGQENFSTIAQARICYVDVDVLIASAPEDYLDKKDSLLAQKFKGIYSDEYYTLNERIGSNIFQVFGIKAEKVKEVYALIPSTKVDAFVPYAHVIRDFLSHKQIDMTRMIVFVDDVGHEKLITVFDGLKFSRTRTINTGNTEDILPDIKRSAIDFNKKLGEFASNGVTGDVTVITNNSQMAEDIKRSEPGLGVEYLDCRYPAFEGLASIDSPMKYRIHEEIILERKKLEWRSRARHVMASMSICLAGALFLGFNNLTYSYAAHDLERERFKNSQLKAALQDLDQHIYRDALKRSKDFNYSGLYFEISGLLPSTYEISSFKITAEQGRLIFDAYLFAQDDQFYDDIPRTKILKNAQIKNFFIKDRPGKYLKVTL